MAMLRRGDQSPTSSLPRATWSVAGPPHPVPIAAARDVEQGDPDGWRAAYAGLAQLGTVRRCDSRGARRRGRQRRGPVR